MRKLFILITCVMMLVACNNKAQESRIIKPNAAIYMRYTEWTPREEGCCDFTTMLQLSDNKKFKLYYRNNQGDYVTVDFIRGTYELGKDSTLVLNTEKSRDSVRSFDMKEFLGEKLKLRPNGINIGSNLALKKVDFSAIDSIAVSRYSFRNGDMEESISISKNGAASYTMARENDKKNLSEENISTRLTPEQFQEITVELNNGFPVADEPQKEYEGNHIFIHFADTKIEFSGSLNPQLEQYFFNDVKSWIKNK